MRATIVVGYDGTLPGGHALAEAGHEALWRRGSVKVVHALQWFEALSRQTYISGQTDTIAGEARRIAASDDRLAGRRRSPVLNALPDGPRSADRPCVIRPFVPAQAQAGPRQHLLLPGTQPTGNPHLESTGSYVAARFLIESPNAAALVAEDLCWQEAIEDRTNRRGTGGIRTPGPGGRPKGRNWPPRRQPCNRWLTASSRNCDKAPLWATP